MQTFLLPHFHQRRSSCAFLCRVGNSPISRVTLVAAFHRSQEAEAARAKILAERALRKERAEQRAQEEAAAAEARAQARQASQVCRGGGLGTTSAWVCRVCCSAAGLAGMNSSGCLPFLFVCIDRSIPGMQLCALAGNWH